MIEMINFYDLAVVARELGISCENNPDIYKQEAWKYAKLFGDNSIHLYSKYLTREKCEEAGSVSVLS